MYDKINGEKAIIMFDGDRIVSWSVDGNEEEYSFCERVEDYINKVYWYLPKDEKKNVLLNHGFSSAVVINNFVFFDTIVPNRNYYNQVQKCREMFSTNIMINNPDNFMFLTEYDVEDIMVKYGMSRQKK